MRGRRVSPSHRPFLLGWALAALTVLPGLRAWGQEADAVPGEAPRRVLALYDSDEPFNTPDITVIHRLLEMPLNRLGLTLDYHDINVRPLPDAMRYRAVITAFGDAEMPAPEEYCRWLEVALKKGVKFVQLGPLGTSQDLKGRPVDFWLEERLETQLGYQPGGVWRTANPLAIVTEDARPADFHFGTREPPAPDVFDQYIAKKPDVQVWRTAQLADQPGSQGLAVAVSPRGGFILDLPYVVRVPPGIFHYYVWDLDLFAFLEAALDCKGSLRPDVTTVCGLRAAYSHIDGDGLGNLTHDFPGSPRLAAQVILEQVLARYPVPVTVGPIVGEVDPAVTTPPQYGHWSEEHAVAARELDVKLPPSGEMTFSEAASAGAEERRETVRQILALPNVQAACHGYAHPLYWKDHVVALKLPGYRFSYEKEISEAVAILEKNFLPPGKKVETFLWTGDCRPEVEGLALVSKLGLASLNGGDSRWDNMYNSLALVRSQTRPVPPYRQVYASATNENLYTAEWTANFAGYRNVLETFRRTETPRRLTPVDIYYHFYSGERLASVRAVQAVYDWALAQPLCWIHASEYVRAVEGFHEARCGQTPEGAWWIAGFGACPTARLDGCTQGVDMERSKGVWGFSHHAGSLYVALAPVARAEIVLTKDAPRTPCLLTSTSRLRAVEFNASSWKAEARIYAPGQVRLQGCAPGRAWDISVWGEKGRATADDQGQLAIPLPRGSGEWVSVRATHGP